MPECTNCSWFKEVTPQNSRVGVLRSLIHSTHAEVEQEMNRIEAEEFGKFQAEEQEVRLKTARAMYLLGQIGGDFHECQVPMDVSEQQLERTVAGFPTRFEGEPQCVTHCSQLSASHVWHIPALRNWAGRCPKHKVEEKKSNCRACIYYVAATGDADDGRELLSLTNALNETDSEAAPLLLSRKGVVEQKIGPQKAAELGMAHNNDGRVPSRLRYLPYCTRHSVVPELWNRFGDCGEFKEAATERRSARPVSIVDPRDIGPAPVLPELPFPAANGSAVEAPGGLRSLPAMPSAPPAVSQPTELASMGASPFGPATTQGRTDQTSHLTAVAQQLVTGVLGTLIGRFTGASGPAAAPSPAVSPRIVAAGSPPLTEEMLRRSTAVASAAFGHPFHAGEAQQYAAFTIGAWNRNLRPAIDAQLQIIGTYEALQSGMWNRNEAALHLQRFLAACGVMAARS